MTGILWAGGSGLVAALGMAIWALWERSRRIDREWACAVAESKARLASEELEAEQARFLDVQQRRDAVDVAQKSRLAELERKLDEVAVLDPRLAGGRLRDVLIGGGKSSSGPAGDGAPAVSSDPSTGLGPGRRDAGR